MFSRQVEHFFGFLSIMEAMEAINRTPQLFLQLIHVPACNLAWPGPPNSYVFR